MPGPNEVAHARQLWRVLGRSACYCVATLMAVGAGGCDDSHRSPQPGGIDQAPGLCLSQVAAGELVVLSLDGRVTRKSLSGTRAGLELANGYLAPDGEAVVATVVDGLVFTTVSGDVRWVLNVQCEWGTSITNDSKRVACATRNGVVLVDASTGQRDGAIDGGRNPMWHPNAGAIAYDDGDSAYIYTLATKSRQLIGKGTAPSWDASGERIALRRSTGTVVVVDVRSRASTTLLDGTSPVSVPKWSPDGEWMTYTRREPRHWWSRSEWTGLEPTQVVVRRLATGLERNIGEVYKANPGDFRWFINRRLCGE